MDSAHGKDLATGMNSGRIMTRYIPQSEIAQVVQLFGTVTSRGTTTAQTDLCTNVTRARPLRVS